MELAEELIKKIPNQLDKEESKCPEMFKSNKQGLIPSLSTVLLQEV
jgi:hypothetical protein